MYTVYGKGSVYTSGVAAFFDHWQYQQKAEWEPGSKANLSIDD